MKSISQAGYNERLFSGGFRSRLHLARFHWLNRVAGLAKCERVLELGCFDGKAIDFLPKKPVAYRGFDANVENGLGLALERWRYHLNYRFSYAAVPADMELSETYDTAICMETLEHIPPELVSPYLGKIAANLNGYFFATFPVEIGPLFLAKYLAKRLLSKDGERYSPSEVFWETLGVTSRVRRDQHKGFDYRQMISEIGRHFDIVSVEGFPWLPAPLSFTVGVVASCLRAGEQEAPMENNNRSSR